jgi:hypothetical protein
VSPPCPAQQPASNTVDFAAANAEDDDHTANGTNKKVSIGNGSFACCISLTKVAFADFFTREIGRM